MPDLKLSRSCVTAVQESDLQTSKERLGPELGSLTGRNVPPQPSASTRVSAEQRGGRVSAVPEGCGEPWPQHQPQSIRW